MGCGSSKPDHYTPPYHPRPAMGVPITGPAYPPSGAHPVVPANGVHNNGHPRPAPAAGPPKCFVPGYHDIHVLVDDSSSMRPTWREAQEGVEALLVEALKYDSDGVDVSFLNAPATFNVKSVAEVVQVFNSILPVGSTPTAEALRRITSEYWTGFNRATPKKPLSVVIVTDGAPNDPRAVETVIVESARMMQQLGLNKGHLGFTFVGIGIVYGTRAYSHLIDLDQNLSRRYRVLDIVDCSSLDQDDGSPLRDRLVKCLFGGVDANLDALHE